MPPGRNGQVDFSRRCQRQIVTSFHSLRCPPVDAGGVGRGVPPSSSALTKGASVKTGATSVTATVALEVAPTVAVIVPQSAATAPPEPVAARSTV